MNFEKIMELKNGKDGERLDIKKTFKWIMEDMSYDDFEKLARLTFQSTTGPFTYRYRINEKADSPATRKDYVEYLCYKLVQNLEDPHVWMGEDRKC